MYRFFEDRHHAGRLLAKRLERYRQHSNCILLGIPRGGLVLAYEIAHELDLPMDVCIVRKLTAPFQRELAIGAIACRDVKVLYREVIAESGITQEEVDREVAKQTEELGRSERFFRPGGRPLQVSGKTVIVVDDGIVSGATAEAAIRCMRRKGAVRLVAAAAVATHAVVEELRWQADEVECVRTPEQLETVRAWHEDLAPVSDEEVELLLAGANSLREKVR